MSEKSILGGKAQSVGKAEEWIFNNGNRRAGPKGEGGKKATPTKATAGRKEAPVSKPMGRAARMVEDPTMRKVTEVTEVSSLKASPSKVAAAPSVATPMPAKSLDVSC